MKNFDLFDNSLFLPSWRERFRLSEIVPRIVLALFVIGLIFAYTLLTHGDPNNQYHVLSSWQSAFIFALAVFQGYVLLFFGTMSAYSAASREISGGMLDFHRVSPTAPAQLALGLWLGATSVEWLIGGGLLLLELGVVIMNVALSPDSLGSLRGVVGFNAALVCCAVLYQIFGVLAGLLNCPRRRASSAFVFAVLVYFLSHFLMVMEGSFTYYLTWFPAYRYLSSSLAGTGSSDFLFINAGAPVGQLYGWEIPFLLMQLLIQGPFIVFMFRVVKRRIALPEHPLMQKLESLALIGVILFYCVGSIVSPLSGDTDSTGLPSREVPWGIMVYVLTLLGYIGVAVATPSYLFFMKGWKRAKKLGRKAPDGWGDYSSNLMWLLGFSGLVAVTLTACGLIFEFSFFQGTLFGVFILSFPWFLGQLLEYFNLSRPRRSRIIMFVVLLTLWFFIPLLGYSIAIPWSEPEPVFFLQYCLAPSPIFGLVKVILALSGDLEGDSILGMTAFNIALIGLVSFLARQQRRRIRSDIVARDDGAALENS
ncbi:MAG TPA: hypothetical protein PLT76_05380 [Candidatus Omnitrophota bacterium]|nr:hypothetical protein [Candidatus Omnitrophota bacterium]HQO58134.1 hypothetical protein [Candidatus Omnitrophota bacterium]HQP12300.1 hypothetical protein [Candidatus Omnitrophota bacterium]